MSRSRGWCFTINNPNDTDRQQVETLKGLSVYLIVGREVGSEGTAHLQGYCYFQNAKAASTLKRLLSRAHLEAAKGSPEQNRQYCSKDGDYEEHGTCPASQKRKGELSEELWELSWKLAKEGRIEEIHPSIRIRHLRTLEYVSNRYGRTPPENLDNVCGLWYYGAPGTGKSTAARNISLDQYGTQPFDKPQSKWWCGYTDQPVILIDDLDTAVLGHYLKRWADKYPFPAEYKGGSMVIRPKLVIVTSNYTIDELFNADGQMRDALKRRFATTHFVIQYG